MSMEYAGLDKNRKNLKFEQYRIRFFGVTDAHADIRTQNTENKSGLWLTYVDAGLSFNIPHKISVFFLHILYVITKTRQ